ncbi:MAG: hypothetical protein A2231_01715 [Candidatus Firestonebacteria bacterium RIFOXYA2_FULL_40_8]|nr:MAG: hypothetical protein A2231_01715 [Candidatus Firestonebacteria bacterium RIFOXYA2_FULL_40_8]
MLQKNMYFCYHNGMNNLIRIKSGVSGLDDMFNGGLIKGSSVLLAGPSGTGKTMLGLQFIKEGLFLKENCVFISMVKDPADVLKYYDVLNVDWDKYINNKKLSLLYFNAAEIDRMIFRLKKIFSKSNIDRAVIDGLPCAVKPGYLVKIRTMINFFKDKHATSYFVTAVSEKNKEVTFDNASFPEMFNSIVLLKQKEEKNEYLKTIALLKAEGIIYDTKIRKVEIGRNGFKVKTVLDKEVMRAPAGSAPVIQLGNDIFLKSKKVEEYLINTFKEKFPQAIIDKPKSSLRYDLENIINDVKKDMGIFTLKFEDVYRLAKDDLLVSLDDYIEKKKFFKGSVEACTFKEKIFGIPDDASCRCLIYRKDLLDKHSVKVPSTWEEMVKAAQYITQKENKSKIAGLLFYNRKNWMSDTFMELLWSNGGNIFDEKGNINVSNKAALESLKFIQDLIYKFKVVPAGFNSQLFYEGRCVFFIATSYAYKEIINGEIPWRIKKILKPSLVSKLALAPLPQMKKNSRNFKILSGSAYCITKNTKDIKSAIMFLKLLTSEKTMRALELKAGHPFPSRVKLWKDKEILWQKPYYAQAEGIMEKYMIPYQSIENYKTINVVIQNETLKVLDRSKPIVDVLLGLESEIKVINKRCKDHERIAKKIIDYLELNYNRQIKLKDISAEVKLNAHYLEKIFKMQTNDTIFEYLIDLRIKKARELLEDTSNNVNEVAYKVGYSDAGYFSKLFKRKTRHTPSNYKLI